MSSAVIGLVAGGKDFEIVTKMCANTASIRETPISRDSSALTPVADRASRAKHFHPSLDGIPRLSTPHHFGLAKFVCARDATDEIDSQVDTSNGRRLRPVR